MRYYLDLDIETETEADAEALVKRYGLKWDDVEHAWLIPEVTLEAVKTDLADGKLKAKLFS